MSDDTLMFFSGTLPISMRFPLVLPLLLLLGFYAGMANGDNRVEVPVATDLAADAELARRGKVPIMLMFSQDHCPFCKTLKREILRPMLLSGEYVDRVIIRELFIDAGEVVRDFNGVEIEGFRVGKRYAIWLTPTLLFLDSQGKELTQRMLGINTVEMYGYYVDESLDAALTNLRTGTEFHPEQTNEDR
ncbi:MAG: thioredoxin fold domain-containing protein [Gammaproteobacteria bacterium]|nr:thioredoxin fold domain-containing protein [Gammaproteobacteria bacterium]